MPQTQTLPPTVVAVAVLKWQVVETNLLGTRWVIAAFDIQEDAERFVSGDSRTLDIREDPNWVARREERTLRRSADVTLALAERDA